MSAAGWVRAPDGVVVTIRLTPKSARDEICGLERLSDGRAVVKAKVRAAPEKGEANEALLRLLASALGAPRSQAALLSGATNRLKTIKVQGDADAIEARLRRTLVDASDASRAGKTKKAQNRS